MFDKGDPEYATLKVYRSVLSAYHHTTDGFKVGQHPLVKDLLRGAFNTKPPKLRYTDTCDVNEVLDEYEKLADNESLSLSDWPTNSPCWWRSSVLLDVISWHVSNYLIYKTGCSLKPHRLVVPCTRARQLKIIMATAGIDMGKYKAHSVRGATTYKASKLGVYKADFGKS